MYLSLFIFIALAAGLMMMFDVNPVREISGIVKKAQSKKTISFKQAIGADKKRRDFIVRWFMQTRTVLETTGRGEKYQYYCRLSFLLAVAGAAIALFQSNIFLIPVLTLTGMMIPLLAIQLSVHSYNKRLNRQIETSLSIITSSYLRSENITRAVRDSMGSLNHPVSDLFARFLFRVDNIDPSVEHALADIRKQTKNPVFKQWCNAMILCQHDRSAKHMLEPIVEKLANIRNTQGSMETEMISPIKVTVVMTALTMLNIPMVYFLNRSWFSSFNTPFGKLAMAFIAAAVLFAVMKCVRAARPLDTRRRDAT